MVALRSDAYHRRSRSLTSDMTAMAERATVMSTAAERLLLDQGDPQPVLPRSLRFRRGVVRPRNGTATAYVVILSL